MENREEARCVLRKLRGIQDDLRSVIFEMDDYDERLTDAMTLIGETMDDICVAHKLPFIIEQ